MRTQLMTATLAFLLLTVAAAYSASHADVQCGTDTECVEQCERDGGVACDDVLGEVK